MKKLFIATLLLGSASLVHAEHKLVSADGSSLSTLCVEAAASPMKVNDIARSHGILPKDLDTVRCNDVPLKRFALKYRTDSAPVAIVETETAEVAGYLLRKNDSSPLTELCAAAAISDQELARVKDAHFSSDSEIESEVLCNGQPLKSFVRKFRNAANVELVGLR